MTRDTCPKCGKKYQRPAVNAADYRVTYYAGPAATIAHMCAQCWRIGR
jgi:hypothetical protein